jgi:tRNA modification GTPase
MGLYRINTSDINICLIPLNNNADIDPIIRQTIDKDTLLILNKEDMFSGVVTEELVEKVKLDTGAKKVWSMSCATGQGLDKFLSDMIDILKSK